MTFSVTVKNEISKLEVSKTEAIAELSAIIRNSDQIKVYDIKVQTENKDVANRIFNLVRVLYNVTPNVTARKNYNFKKNNIYIIDIKRDTVKILYDLGILNNKNELLRIPKDFLTSDEEQLRAYLRGCFLISGSLNDPKTSRYHLEFLINDRNYALYLNDLLNKNNLNSKFITRVKGYMVYIKESEKISDFLRMIKAYNAVMYYEDIRIYRDHVNMTNRLNNCEQANIEKTIRTSLKQIEDINLIEEKGTLELLDDKTKVIATYRKKYPEVSLQELSNIISTETEIKITKSGLNHHIIKIRNLASKIRENSN